MADATPSGETGKPADPKTDATPPVTPQEPVKTEDPAVAQLRKEKEQAEMRANQLTNQLKAKEEAEAEAQRKKLEEDNQYKELFEQEKAKNEALAQEQETKEKQAELDKAKAETLAGFSEDVKKLADGLGIELLDTDEQSVEAYKGKLETISAQASTEARITPNNPNRPESKVDLTPEQLRETLSNDDAFHDYVVKTHPGIAAMTNKAK